MLGVQTDFTVPMSLSNQNSPSVHQTKSSVNCRNKVRMDNNDGLKEDYYFQNEACDTHSKRSSHVKNHARVRSL
jgi:hypothetical protein